MKPQTYKNFKDLNLLKRKRSSQIAGIEDKPASPLTPHMDGISEDELFEHSMKDVIPLRWNSVPVRGWHPIEIKNQSQQEESGIHLLLEFVQGRTAIDLETTGEYVEGAPHPKGKFLLRHLRSGHYAVEANLDLHGLSIREARALFEAFFKDSLHRSLGCVRIVHGRGHHSKDGHPVLKQNLQRWLQSRRFSRHVVAYASAQPHDGGCGAIYILLKNCRS
jgi:DNA-nicking Smr family endonuclease